MRTEALSLQLPAEVFEELSRQVAEHAAALAAKQLREDRWLELKTAAEYLDCSPRRLYEFVGRDLIPHERDGRRILFLRSELDAWVRNGGAKRIGR